MLIFCHASFVMAADLRDMAGFCDGGPEYIRLMPVCVSLSDSQCLSQTT